MRLSVYKVVCQLLIGVPIFCQQTDRREEVKRFVEDFYKWYVPLTQKDSIGDAFYLAIEKKPESFDPEFVSLLKREIEFQRSNPGEIPVVNYDPFLLIQDIPDTFLIDSIDLSNGIYRIVVSAKIGGESVKTVTPKVINKNGKWIFSDFCFPNGDSLFEILKSNTKPSKEVIIKSIYSSSSNVISFTVFNNSKNKISNFVVGWEFGVSNGYRLKTTPEKVVSPTNWNHQIKRNSGNSNIGISWKCGKEGMILPGNELGGFKVEGKNIKDNNYAVPFYIGYTDGSSFFGKTEVDSSAVRKK